MQSLRSLTTARSLFQGARALQPMSPFRRMAHGHAHPVVAQTTLLGCLKEKFPGQDAVVAKRLEQLKRNHSITMFDSMRFINASPLLSAISVVGCELEFVQARATGRVLA
jgi:hypothetical protein